MSLGSNKVNIVVVRGDKFTLPIRISDSFSNSTFQIVSVSPASRTITIVGNYASSFTSGTVFSVSGNTNGNTNGTYAVSSSANSGDNTVITVTANLSFSIIAIETLNDTITVSGDQRLFFPNLSSFIMTGNTGNVLANKEYDVDYAYYNGTNTIIRTVQDVPQGATVTGSLIKTTIPSRSSSSGYVRPLFNKEVDITDYTITSQIRTSGGDLVDTFTVTKTSATEGLFELSLTGNQTNALELNSIYEWDVLIDRGDDDPIRIPEGSDGKLRVRNGVTKS